MLRERADGLSARYPVRFDRIWVNLYRDGADSVAWHGDRNRLGMTKPIVATGSLQARRKFLLRPRGTRRLREESVGSASQAAKSPATPGSPRYRRRVSVPVIDVSPVVRAGSD